MALLPDALPLKAWPPARSWRASSCAALTRCFAREWREELPLLRRRWRLIAACAAMQYVHAIAGQVCAAPARLAYCVRGCSGRSVRGCLQHDARCDASADAVAWPCALTPVLF
jgi:hypothetical protein